MWENCSDDVPEVHMPKLEQSEYGRMKARLCEYERIAELRSIYAERDAAEEIIAPLRDEVITALKVKREAEAAFIEAATQAERSRQCMVAAQEQTRLQADAFAAREAELETALKSSVSADVFNILRAERDDLEAALAERALDTERLDWLDEQTMTTIETLAASGEHLRAAIDSAQKGAPDAER